MKEYIDTLNTLIQSPNIEKIDNLTEELDVHLVKELYDRGFIDGVYINNKSTLGFIEPKVNIIGKEWLAAQESSNQVLREPKEDMIDLKPNFMGVGVNFNAVFRRVSRKFKKQT